ncbi:MAG: 16S rRNA (guanine(527)-N(7))-methyltransferase RsmG [Candidatus Dadabacteria bacterium]|nr:16S rRNA (guanine(527)-N(7))-methyltransferase RsmG [Candidatus Dadabacteria bacterium]
MKLDELLVNGAKELGAMLTSGQVALFLEYLKKIKSWNKRINITGIDDERKIVINHFLDSITTVQFVSEYSRVLDIGSGGGFPGIPLKIIKPSLELILIDSIQKKVFFMRDVIRRLGLKEIKAILGRAEDAGNEIPRAYFDLVVSRAIGEIDEILDLGAPYLRERGEIILMRGKKGIEEWEEIEHKSRNFKLKDFKKVSLPYSRHERTILIVTKVL